LFLDENDFRLIFSFLVTLIIYLIMFRQKKKKKYVLLFLDDNFTVLFLFLYHVPKRDIIKFLSSFF